MALETPHFKANICLRRLATSGVRWLEFTDSLRLAALVARSPGY
jgi:hypothetical protein